MRVIFGLTGVISKGTEMGIFDLFVNKTKRYVTQSMFEKNTSNQELMTPKTLAQLRGYDVGQDKELRLEFFFYTNTSMKAHALAAVLTGMKYEVKHGPSASNKSIQVITGWTDKLVMHDATVLAWTKEMCKIGFDNDCEFDGWGTNPEQ